MKPVFKCDYCSTMGTEEEIKEHEPVCSSNHDRKSCHTCVHKKLGSKDGQLYYECKINKEIPQGKIIEFCDSYERKGRPEGIWDAVFGDFF